MTKKKTLDELLEEALFNAREDRIKTLEAFEKMKPALDASDPDKTVIMGKTAGDLLEQLTRSNEQIVRLAQIRERQEAKMAELKANEENEPFDIESLQKEYEETKDTKN